MNMLVRLSLDLPVRDLQDMNHEVGQLSQHRSCVLDRRL